MACNCKKSGAAQYVWTGTSKDGATVQIVYPTLIQAKAAVMRNGGSYTEQVRNP